MEESLETFQALDPVNFLRKFTTQNVRPDSRPLHRVRPTTVVKSVFPRNTYGSALVRIGDTQAVAAVTLLVGHPPVSAPDHGEIEVSLCFSPLCSGKYNVMGRVVQPENRAESPTDPHAIESFVQRTVRTSGVIDPTDLCIERGSSAWKLRISIVILNHDGNVEDAAILGAVAALADTRLPRTTVGEDGIVGIIPSGNEENASENGSKLLLRSVPVPLTVGLFDGKMLVDPSGVEEEVLGGAVTVVVNSTKQLLSLNKTGSVLLSPEDIAACVELGFGRAKEMEPILTAEQ